MSFLNRKGFTFAVCMILAIVSWSSPALYAQNADVITGTVIDENGLPLIGAGVLSSDGKSGVITDLDGKYSISVSSSDKFLSFSYIGYATQKIVIDGRKVIDVTLTPDMANTLNEVVVIGYGATKKSDLTGSVASMKMADIENTPTTSVDQALQGKIAGVDVMSTSGEPGAGTSIRVRGTRSIEAPNEPLIVVDGVMDAVMDLSEINPDDIESMSILKDASSTAIYGSRGANGVVIITTRKGVTVKPRLNAKVTFGVSSLARQLDIMNSYELIQYRNDYAYIDTYINKPQSSITAKYDIKDYPNAYAQYANEITLPLHTCLTDEQVEYVIENYKRILGEYIV